MNSKGIHRLRLKSLQLKKITSLWLAMVFMVLGGACVTSGMWTDKDYKQEVFYETVNSFLVSADQKKIVVLGKNTHYVFDFNPKLRKALALQSVRSYMTASFKDFNMFTDTGKVFGGVLLKVADTKLTPAQRSQLKALHYRKVKRNDGVFYESFYSLKGKYYLAGGFQLPSNSKYLNQSYSVKLIQQTPKDATTRKVLLTPLTLVADGVLLIGAIPVGIISMVLD